MASRFFEKMEWMDKTKPDSGTQPPTQLVRIV